MSESKKERLTKALLGLVGVKAAECYEKSVPKGTFDILVSTENGRLIEATLSCKNDLEMIEKYVSLVITFDRECNIRSYPNTVSEGEVDSE